MLTWVTRRQDATVSPASFICTTYFGPRCLFFLSFMLLRTITERQLKTSFSVRRRPERVRGRGIGWSIKSGRNMFWNPRVGRRGSKSFRSLIWIWAFSSPIWLNSFQASSTVRIRTIIIIAKLRDRKERKLDALVPQCLASAGSQQRRFDPGLGSRVAKRESSEALESSLRGTSTILKFLSGRIASLVLSRYLAILWSLASYFPFTCCATSCESLWAMRLSTFNVLACYQCFILGFVVGCFELKPKCILHFKIKASGLVKSNPAPLYSKGSCVWCSINVQHPSW